MSERHLVYFGPYTHLLGYYSKQRDKDGFLQAVEA